MKETFLTTYSFVYEQTVDTETGEIINSKLLDKKVVVSEKPDPEEAGTEEDEEDDDLGEESFFGDLW